jgi:cytochrome P450
MAGTDTASISLTFFLWELTRRPDIVTKLRAELDDAMPDPKVLPDITALNELPYLNAFLKEGTYHLSHVASTTLTTTEKVFDYIPLHPVFLSVWFPPRL